MFFASLHSHEHTANAFSKYNALHYIHSLYYSLFILGEHTHTFTIAIYVRLTRTDSIHHIATKKVRYNLLEHCKDTYHEEEQQEQKIAVSFTIIIYIGITIEKDDYKHDDHTTAELGNLRTQYCRNYKSSSSSSWLEDGRVFI